MDGGSAGIILRRATTSRYKFALLDKQHGRMEVIAHCPDLMVGSLMTYTISKAQRGNYFLSHSALLYVPLSLGQADLLFFHHVLELIYYFAPIGSCTDSVFDLLAFLYTAEHMFMSVQFKKFFLLQLLTLMGAAPELDSIRTNNIDQLAAIVIGQFKPALIDNVVEKELDRWLWYCIWQHPYVKEFKTVHFLEKNRTL